MKRNSKWIQFDFGSENLTKPKTKKQKANSNLTKQSTEKLKEIKILKSFNYEKQIEPKTVEDLSIHSKKVQDVKSWLETFVIKKTNKTTASYLLLSGPTGCGKSTTLKVLCKDLNISLSEWVNPVDQEFQGQKDKFLEFLIESKWNSLFDDNDRKILVVDEFPNAVVKKKEDFYDILEECFYNSNNAIIFVCSDDKLQYNLFPEEIMQKYQIAEISFNPCAPTLLKSALQRVQTIIGDQLKAVSKTTIEAIISTSMGDIRNAVNQFYFAALKGSDQLPLSPAPIPTKSKRKDIVVKTMNRDETLGLFHGIGRVLNPKPDDNLMLKAESVINEFSTQPKMLYDFLFENYIKYFGDFNDIVKGIDYLSVAQSFHNYWESPDCLSYSSWLSVMGLMLSNKNRVAKWNQIKGPKKIKSLKDQCKRINLDISDYYIYCKIFKEEPVTNYNNLIN